MAEHVTKVAGAPALVSVDNPGVVLIGDPPVRWVEVPAELGALASRRIMVEDTIDASCPVCQGPARRYLLAPTPAPNRPGKILTVIECAEDGFLWIAVFPFPHEPRV
jgi:hypothetical protein